MEKEKLTAQIKRELNITWSDKDTDARVEDIISSTDAYLRHLLGITAPSFDFSAPGIENTLFRRCCFYDWNHASDEFEENYLSMIMQARAKYASL